MDIYTAVGVACLVIGAICSVAYHLDFGTTLTYRKQVVR